KALKAGRFSAQAKNLRLFRSIATMDRKAPLPRPSGQNPTWHKAAALARDWELKQLAKRPDDLAAQSSAAKSFRGLAHPRYNQLWRAMPDPGGPPSRHAPSNANRVFGTG